MTAAFIAAAFGNAVAAEQRAVLTLRVNTVAKQEVTVILRGDDVLVSRADLEAAGLRGFAFEKTAAPAESISLNGLKPALTFHIDDVALALDISVAPEHLESTVVDYRPRQGISLSKPAKSAFLNYSVATSDQSGATLAGEFGTHIGAGSFTSTVSVAANSQYRSNLTRWVVDSPGSDRRLTLGDVVTSTGDLGGTVAIAGFGLQRYFGLNPDIIKTALPQVTGNALTPSTADVYVNGVLYRHETLPPGQFNFQNLPVAQGPNNTTIVVTDAFGRQQTYSNYFYGADTLLARGISDFSYGLGALHSQFGEQAGHGLAASARYEAGFSDNVTGGGRFEISPTVISGGPAFGFRLRHGVLNVQTALSRAQGTSGAAGLLSYQYVDPRLTAGVALTFLSPQYATLALRPDQDRTTFNGALSLARQLGRNGGISVSYIRQNDRDNGVQNAWQVTQTVMLRDAAQLQVSESLTNAGGSKQFGVQTNLSFVPRKGLNASVGSTATNGQLQTSVQVQHALDSQTPSFGYTLSATGGAGSTMGYASLQYRGQYGDYFAGLGTGAQGNSLSANVAGGVVFIGGKLYPTQSVSDGYALVDTDGLSRVTVLANNIVAGRTNRSGYLLVPRLGSYMNNDISIQSSDLPMNYSIDGETRRFAPAYRSGDIIHFKIAQVRPVTGTLLVKLGSREIVPAFGIVELQTSGMSLESDIGDDGAFYFDNLQSGAYHARVRFKEGECRFDLIVPKSDSTFVKLGRLVCANGVPT